MPLLLLAATVKAQAEYKMAGPYEVVARDGEYRASKAGSERDMKAALDFAVKGQYAEAQKIIDAYARTLQRFDGHDAPLCCIQAYWLVSAMNTLKLKVKSEKLKINNQVWEAMIRRAILPTIDKFEADSPYANGNWGAIVNRCRMACAIFLEDSTLYRKSVDYFLHANDNGSLPYYISETGQCQETGRDQGHAQLGLGVMCDIAEMAWEYGASVNCKSVKCKYHDLWGALDNRLMQGIEYSARYNLGYDVPFETWQDQTGLYCNWTEPGAMGRGRLWDIYEKPYNHYVKRLGLKMPYTKKVLALQSKARKEGTAQVGQETTITLAPGVEEGKRLHQVFTYPAPKGAPLKRDYDVYVQPRGSKEWTKIDTYMAKVNAPIGNNKHQISEISYSVFDFTGDVFVRVVTKDTKFKSARIRPDYRGTIANVLNDSTVQFLLFQPENVSVEFDGDITNNLLVFTSKPSIGKAEAEAEAKTQGRKFLYYAPGLYDKEDTIRLASNTTVYLEGGSYFTGTFAIDDAHDVSILGRGIARPKSGYQGAHVYRSRNVVIDGLTLNTCPIGGSDGVILRDVRSISFPGWGDGLNAFASQNVLYDRVFCRNSDDCTTAYATRKGFSGDCRNVTMRNSTLWADVAHPIFIGIHGNSQRGDTIENLRYENIDILYQSEPQVDYQGCLAINCGDNNLVRNVVFDNIRIEQIHQGSILQVKVGYNQKYCTAPGRAVENVTFRNIRYYGEQPYMSVITGYDDGRKVRNIQFEGLKINGQTIYDDMPGKPRWYQTADYVPLYVGSHVENVVFTPQAGRFAPNLPLAYCSTQLDRALEALRPYDFTMMPRNILNEPQDLITSRPHNLKSWNLRPAKAEEWCSGFWPGILWMAFEYNKSEAVKKAAEGYTEAIFPIIDQPVYDHDLGFIVINSLLKGYEQTKDERYRRLALRAADSLATLFNPHVGTILSWPRHVKDYGGHNTIMDNMMNLELLFWAAEENEKMRNGEKEKNVNSKLSNCKLYDIALRHAETTMKYHFRKDGSCYHVAVYNPETGKFIKGVTHQGYSDQSMWSRGQAWAIYGYTMVYRYTRDKRFLDFAQKVTDIYLKRLRETSDDMIPLWDMDDPEAIKLSNCKLSNDNLSNCKLSNCKLKDASAACIVASALLELCQYAPDKGYREEAEKMLSDLSTPCYQCDRESVAFLKHSTGHRPAGSEIDASIVYADYYYLEALLRLKKLSN